MSTVTQHKTSSPSTRQRSTKKTSSKPASSSVKSKPKVEKSAAKSTGDKVKLSKDAGVQPNQAAVPNFQSWAAPGTSKGSELKPLAGDTLERRAQGDNVKDLQSHLNSAGAKLEVDGKFGAQTQKAVRKFQKQNNLKVDGKVGPKTMEALNKGASPEAAKKADPATPPKAAEGAKKADPAAPPKAAEGAKKADPAAPPKAAEGAKKADPTAPPKAAEGLPQLADKKMTTQEKYDHYAAMVKAAGGKLDEKNPTVLGLRGLSLDGSRHNSGRNTGSDDDTFVVLGRDKAGKPTVSELHGATHAATPRGSIAGGVAQLRPGNYEVNRRENYHGHEAWAVGGGGNVPVYRDGNRDGVISEAEKAAAVRNKTTGDGILFHFDRHSSIGCQTLPVDQLKKLKAAVNGGNFHYTLIDANQAQ